MTVMILERVPPSTRGDLSRWMLEIKAGVFVGRINKLVRDNLWERVNKLADEGTVLQVWTMNNEQGFDLRYTNPKGRIPVKMEDIWLIMTPKPKPKN